MLVMEKGSLNDSPTNHLITKSSAAQASQISLCLLVPSIVLEASIAKKLQSDRYVVLKMKSAETLVDYVSHEHHQLDCLVVEYNQEFIHLVHQLQQQSIFLPIVLITPESSTDLERVETPSITHQILTSGTPKQENFAYHSCEVDLNINQLDKLDVYIDQAIRKFITHAITTRLSDPLSDPDTPTELTESIVAQQKRLAEKLHERLGYLGVYYKRNPTNFLRNLPSTERQELLGQLQLKYRQIVLNYFSKDPELNNKIDEYVNIAFFADIPISRVVQIHMELMDNLSKQLKLEGRNEDVLLDYRLTLIDIMAHLCEMYRRSIPKES